MSAGQPSTRMELQLRSIPVLNKAAKIERTGSEGLALSVPLQHRGWSKALKRILPLSEARNVELDRLGAEVLSLCDGRRTVEKIIDLHKDQWQLSFFESRGMVFQFLKMLMKHDFIVLVAPRLEG